MPDKNNTLPDDFLSEGFYGRGRKIFTEGPRSSTVPNPQMSPEGYDRMRQDAGLENVSLPYDQEMLNEMAYQSQSWGYNLAAGVGRTAAKAFTEILATPGYIAAGVQGVTGNGWDNAWLEKTRDLDQYFKNQMPIYTSRAIDEGGIINKLTDTAWWGTTGADGLGFMVAMMAPGKLLSAMGMGRALARGVGGVGRGLEAITGTTTAAEMLEAGTRLSTNGFGRFTRALRTVGESQKAVNMAESGLNLFVNTMAEASAEANGTYLNLTKELVAKGYSKEKAEELAGNAASSVFGVNLAILAASNFVLEKYLLKGFDTQANISRRLGGMKMFDDIADNVTARTAAQGVREGAEQVAKEGVEQAAEGVQRAAGEAVETAVEGMAPEAAQRATAETLAEGVTEAAGKRISSKGPAPMGFKEQIGHYAKSVVTGFSTESIQEGMQTSAEQLFSQMAEEGDLSQPWNIPGNMLDVVQKLVQNVGEFESTQQSREFYEAAVLGGVLGGGPGIYGTRKGIQEEEEMLFGNEAVKPREKTFGSTRIAKALDAITGREEKAPSKGMIKYFKEMVQNNSIPYSEFLQKDENGNFITDENANYVIDQEKVKAIAGASEEHTKQISMLAMAEAVLTDKKQKNKITVEEEAVLDGIKNRRESMMLSPYINYNGGVEIFKQHVDEIVNRMYEENPSVDAATLAKERLRLVDKVERLTKQREVIDNTQRRTTEFLLEEPGTQDQKMMFGYNLLADKKFVGSQMDFYDNALKEIDQEIFMLEEEKKKAERDNVDFSPLKETELEQKKEKRDSMKELYNESVNNYNDLFNIEKQKKEYADFLNDKGKYKQSEEERMREEIKDPEYINKLFKKKGVDYNEDFDEIHIDFNGTTLLLTRKDGKLLLTNEARTAYFEYRLRDEADPSKGYAVFSVPITEQNKDIAETTQETIDYLLKRDPEMYIISDKEESATKKKERIDAEFQGMRREMIQQLDEKIEEELKKAEELEAGLNETIALLEDVETKKKELQEESEKKINNLKENITRIAKELKSKRKPETKQKLQEQLDALNVQLKEAEAFAKEEEKKADKQIKEISALRNKIKNAISKDRPGEMAEFFRKYKEKIENIINKYEMEAADQISAAEMEFLNQIVLESLQIDPQDTIRIKTIEELLKKEISKNTEFKKVIEEEYKGVFEEADKALNETIETLEKRKQSIYRFSEALTKVKRQIEDIEEQIKNLESDIIPLTPEEEAKIKELQKQKEDRLLKSERFQKKISELAQDTLDLMDRIDMIIQLKGMPIKQSVQEISAILGRTKKRLTALENIRIISELKTKARLYKPAEEEADQSEESKDKEINAVNKNLLRPTTAFLLTGREVEFEIRDGIAKDLYDEDGKLIFNPNPYSRGWFDFTNGLAKGALSRVSKEKNEKFGFDVNKANDYFITTYDNAPEEVKKAIDASYQFDETTNPGISSKKKEGLYVYVTDKKGKIRVSRRAKGREFALFTSLRSLDNIEQKIGLSDEQLEKEIKRYTAFVNDVKSEIESGGKPVKIEMKNEVGSKFYNRIKGKGSRLADIFPSYFNDDKARTVKFAKNLNVSEGEEFERFGRKYRLNPGTPYFTISGAAPLILHQRNLNDDEINTIMALLADERESIDGVDVLELLGTMINFGKRSKNKFEIYKKGSRVYFRIGDKSNSINVSLLSKDEADLTDAETIKKKELVEFLKKKYFYINKNFLEKNKMIPFLENGTIKTKEVNYTDYLLANVLEARIDKDKPFVQSNLVIDNNSFKPIAKPKPKSTETREPQKGTKKPGGVSTATRKKFNDFRDSLFDELEAVGFDIDGTKQYEQVYGKITVGGDELSVVFDINGYNVVVNIVSGDDFIPLDKEILDAISKIEIDDTYKSWAESFGIKEDEDAGEEDDANTGDDPDVVDNTSANLTGTKPEAKKAEQRTSKKTKQQQEADEEYSFDSEEDTEKRSERVNKRKEKRKERREEAEKGSVVEKEDKKKRPRQDEDEDEDSEESFEPTPPPTKPTPPPPAVPPVAPTPTAPAPVVRPTDIEQQRADIERRRQKAIDSIRIDQYAPTLIQGQVAYTSNEPDKSHPVKGQTIGGFSKQSVAEQINAKYDAELAALGKPTAPVTPAAPVAEPSVPESKPVAQQPKQQEKSAEKIELKGEKFYFPSPDYQNRFPASWGKKEYDEMSSVFEIYIDGNQAVFQISSIDRSQRFALSQFESRVKPVSFEPDNSRNENTKRIIVETPGKAELKDGYWVVTQKMKVLYDNGQGELKYKIITLDETKARLKNLEESGQVTKKCN